ncbi:dual specificity protein phosphatase family protein [Halomonas sp. PAMB 3264]|uniref:phosphatase domain-containing protein n=1 Tax=Halomonas sp. PAMB 3264 TaxID=3075222 RepID=UPI0028988B64|nr:dual specificity protein phosphatase family protein [Halomonas sp. PAMB 3264]WNL41411.1 dual specificity protein phosphatase family protein [Halomonas sp. PAMB 3264]
MRHLFWLVEGRVAGRAGPNMAAWSPQALAEGGIRAVLTLNRGHEVDVSALNASGIAHRRVPVPVQAPPQFGAIDIALPALGEAGRWVWEQSQSGRPVLVHCTHGKDRTGLVFAYLLVRYYAMTAAQAIAEVRRVRPIALSALGWEPFAHEVLALVESPRC